MRPQISGFGFRKVLDLMEIYAGPVPSPIAIDERL